MGKKNQEGPGAHAGHNKDDTPGQAEGGKVSRPAKGRNLLTQALEAISSMPLALKVNIVFDAIALGLCLLYLLTAQSEFLRVVCFVVVLVLSVYCIRTSDNRRRF